MASHGGVTEIVTGHLARLRERLLARTTESPEALLADLIPALVKAVAQTLKRPNVDLLGQVYEGAIGRPDFSVKDGGLLIGHVETKPPGAGANTGRFRGHDRSQWERFKRLPNLLYTDGSEFALYRSGVRTGDVISLPFEEEEPHHEVAPSDAQALTMLLADFLEWHAVAPRTLSDLAQRLAPLCSLLRDAVADQLTHPESEVAKAAREVQDALFADRSPSEVADAFAQVCAYSMLLARSRGARRLASSEIEETLGHAHPVLGRVVRLLVDEGTEGELGWALDTVRALVEAVDFAALEARSGSDTWLYFYETFLAQYDPRLRNQYGVYYTPAPVISAQVAMLDEVIRTRLERREGLAAEGVTVLDPAVGTGSYALQVIESVAATKLQTSGVGAVPGAVNSLARNLYAFEILVGPYAVAHLRISELIARHGGTLPPNGIQVFLTDTLDNPYVEPLDFGRQLEPLVEERRRALDVKSGREILVCLGNPPYERLSAEDASGEEKGGWVVHGEGGGAGAAALFSTFLDPAREATIFSHIASLYNLYVYFWRWALWKVFEAPNIDGTTNGKSGIVSFITASSYLEGPGFVGMREHLRRLCDEVWIIDLGGEGHGARKEENVFAIQTPVAICVAARAGTTSPDEPATVRYARIRGSRAEKLNVLSSIEGLADVDWMPVPHGWHDPFMPAGTEAWSEFPALTDLFPFQTPGTKVNRTWPVAVTADSARRRWRALAAAPKEEKATYLAPGSHGLTIATDVVVRHPPPASTERVEDIGPTSPEPPIVRYGWRSFDRQWIAADPRVINLPRPPLWWAHGDRQTYMVSLLTGVIGRGPAATIASDIPDLHFFRGRGGKDVIPLYRDPTGSPNVASGALQALGGVLGEPVAGEDLFAYAYAMLSSRAYTDRFWDELERAGPRLPITRDGALFGQVAELGRRLINLHTFGERLPQYGRGVNPGQARLEVQIGPAMPEELAYDPDDQALRVGPGQVAPVDPGVWEYEVSGLRVLRSWLRYRLREPAGRARSSRSPLDRIRPTEWTSELDDALLEVVWVLERTLALEGEQRDLLEAVWAGQTVRAHELPAPTEVERSAPALR